MKTNVIIVFCIALLSFASLATPSYSINLMWINKEKSENQKFFCSSSADEKEYEKLCVNPIVDWLNKSDKSSSINIWYDQETTNNSVVDKLKQDIQAKTQRNLDKLKFMNVRELPDVRNNEDVFGRNMPIYFRVDLLRAIVADYLAKSEAPEFVVYADLNIPAMEGQELFDQETKEKLAKFGFVMAQNNAADMVNNFENAFFIIDARNANLLQAARVALIDANIARGQEFLQRGYTKASELSLLDGKALCKSMFDEIVYVSYKSMFAYYLYLEMALEIIWDHTLAEQISYIQNDAPQKDRTAADMRKSWDALVYIREKYKGMIFPFSSLYEVPAAAHDQEQDNRYLFQHGYATVGYTKLFGSENTFSLAYLAPLKEAATSAIRVQEEKENRKRVEARTLFTVHKPALAKPYYRWIYKTYLSVDKPVSLITLSPRLGSLPVKQVNKPRSSFYNKRPITGDDC